MASKKLSIDLSNMRETELSGIPADSDYYDKDSNTVYKVVNIKIKDIDPSEANNSSRSIIHDEVRVLADSIRDYGLKDPIRVYLNRSEKNHPGFGNISGILPKYTILSGHRRFDAFRLLNEEDGMGIDSIPCIVCEKPADKIEEYIDVAQSNISRRKPQDLKVEIQAANEIWNEICKDQERKNQYVGKLEKAFETRYEKNDKYIADPHGFKRNHYRARLEFIRSVTGLDVSNATIKTYLAKTVEKASDETEIYFTPPKYNTEPSTKKLIRKFDLLKKHVTTLYLDTDPELCEQLLNGLDELIETIK